MHQLLFYIIWRTDQNQFSFAYFDFIQPIHIDHLKRNINRIDFFFYSLKIPNYKPHTIAIFYDAGNYVTRTLNINKSS